MPDLPNRSVDSDRRPWIMGILNVTPDSFSDGGRFASTGDALARAEEMIAEGADIIDVGPESTRPGADDVPADEQIARAVPVIRAIRERYPRFPLSIDVRLAAVAEAALDAGADMVNDTAALRDDDRLMSLIARRGCHVVLMHRRGTPATMQAGGGPQYDDVVGEITQFLLERARFAESHGIDRSRIVLDPGIGFGKRTEHNLAILRHTDRFTSLGYPVLIGASRKRFIASLLSASEPPEAADPTVRLCGSLACAAVAALGGASMLRVHDVRETIALVRLLLAIHQSD